MSFGRGRGLSDSILMQPLRCRRLGGNGYCREKFTPVLVHLARVLVHHHHHHHHSKQLIVGYRRGLIQFLRLVARVQPWKHRPMIRLLTPDGFWTRNPQVNGMH